MTLSAIVFAFCFVEFLRHEVSAIPRGYPAIHDPPQPHEVIHVVNQESYPPNDRYSQYNDVNHPDLAVKQSPWDAEQAVPIRQQYKQLFEYSRDQPKDLETELFSQESKEKFSGEVDDEGEPVIISHNFKEHKLSQKERQKIFEAPYNLLSPPTVEENGANYNFYQISSPFRRKDFKLPKDPLILAPSDQQAPVPYVIRPTRPAVQEQARFSDDHDPGVDTSLIHRPTTKQRIPPHRS